MPDIYVYVCYMKKNRQSLNLNGKFRNAYAILYDDNEHIYYLSTS